MALGQPARADETGNCQPLFTIPRRRYSRLNADRAIGFVELNFKLFPQVEIVFVGLVEDVIGGGLGQPCCNGCQLYLRARPAASSSKPARWITHRPAALSALVSSLGRKKVTIIDDER